ncbi:MAG: hypothetical protein ACTSU5_14285 [Promethearchaeota archaeon]
MSFLVTQELRNNAYLRCEPAKAPVKQGEDVLLIIDQPGFQYSVATRVESIEPETERGPEIVVDKRVLERIPEDSEVRCDIIGYPLVEAESVTIALPDTSKLFNGDWTENVKPSLEGKVIDYGSAVTFMIPFESGPIIGSGRVYVTVPKCPVCVGPSTRVYLKKFPPDILTERLDSAEGEKEARAAELKETLANKSLDAVMALRTRVDAYVENSYPFEKSEPALLFKSLVDTFSAGYQVVEAPRETRTDREGYSGTVLYAMREGGKVKNLVEIQVAASGNQGRVVIGVYSEDTAESSQFLNIIYKKVSALKLGLQERAESMEVKCPVCGNEKLPKEEADINGFVRCQYCRHQVRLPKYYRH